MLEIIKNNLLPCTLNVITVSYLLGIILKNKINFRNYKNYILFILLIVFSIVNFIYVQSFLRFFVSTIFTIIYAKLMFKDFTHKVITAVIIEQMIMFISELIYMLVVIMMFRIDDLTIFGTIVGALIPNIFICLIAIVLVKTKVVRIITDNKAFVPKEEWLDKVVTTNARNKIMDFIKEHD